MAVFNIEEALRNGIKPEDIIKDFQAEVTKTQEKLTEENQKEEKVAKARSKVVYALGEYLMAQGLVEELDSKWIDEVDSIFKAAEGSMDIRILSSPLDRLIRDMFK